MEILDPILWGWRLYICSVYKKSLIQKDHEVNINKLHLKPVKQFVLFNTGRNV